MERRSFIRVATVGTAASAFSSFNGFTKYSEHQPIPSHSPKDIQRFGDGRDWFFNKRYGMFVHWGLYSILGWHEQHQLRAKVPRDEYIKLTQQWNPIKFNPEKWLDLLQEVGMEYITFTAKHHDGFCLWNSVQTSFNTMNTPYKKDIVGLISDACHKRGIPFCIYYSIVDWNHPNYPNQGRHHELTPQSQDQSDWLRYIDFLKAQIKELCTNYGEINGFWWDMNVLGYKDTSINELIRRYQPNAVINNRGFDDGDFGTPELDYNTEAVSYNKFYKPTEACQSVGMESWGYKIDEDYYTDRHIIKSIDSYLARDANYLLNVGPTAEGVIPQKAGSYTENYWQVEKISE